jgi:hypothetical protein
VRLRLKATGPRTDPCAGSVGNHVPKDRRL